MAESKGSDSFTDGIRAGKQLMFNRMLALSRLLIESGDATPMMAHFIRQMATEEGFSVVRGEVRPVDDPLVRGTSGDATAPGVEGDDPSGDSVPEVREADRS